MELFDMFKKSTIYFLTLLLFMPFSELSVSEEVEEEIFVACTDIDFTKACKANAAP